MRKYITSAMLLILISGSCYAQSGNWQILTTSRPLKSINFISPTKAWVFGGDYGYKSSDGGITWSIPIKLNPPVGSIGNRTSELIFFIDSLKGWACQYTDILLKTTNGGNNWSTLNAGINYAKLYTIYFKGNIGIAGGRLSTNESLIIKSTNGGLTWYNLNFNISREITNIFMLNDLKYFACLNFSDTIYATTNGGISWAGKKIGNGQIVNRVTFIDSLNGWALGDYQYVSRTTNGGLNWIVYPNSIGNTTNIFMLDLSTGWITDPGGRIWKSTNSGLNWFIQRPGLPGSSNYLSNTLDVFFENGNTGWVTCGNGIVLKSTNSGTNWSHQINPPLGTIISMEFINENSGWALSNYSNLSDFSYIYKTVNRGYYFDTVLSIENLKLSSLDFINTNVGYVCGDSGNILKTSDGGGSWSNINFGNNNYRSLYFSNTTTGYVCGSLGSMIKTTDGGTNWQVQLSGISKNLNDVFFVTSQVGFAASDSGYVLKTTNAGFNWIPSFLNSYQNFKSIHFVDVNTGFIIGDRFYVSGQVPRSERIVLKTTNSGLNWSRPINENLVGFYTFSDIIFLNSQTGWLVMGNENVGYISKSTNSGDNWTQDFGPVGTTLSFYNGGLYSLAKSNDYIWAAGMNGTVISTSPPVGIQSTSSEIPSVFVLSQNYPNPFNPQTKIKFDIPKLSLIKIIIYDLLGREVATLVNEELSPGTYEADWNASSFSSGVYFYKIIAGDFTQTKKMVLMK